MDTTALAEAAGITQDETDARTPSDRLDENAERGEARTPLQGQQTIDGQEVRVPVEEIRVDGTRQLALGVGGKEPTSCKLTLSGSAAVVGRFDKGERITGTFEAVVVAATAKDKLDKQTQIVTECGLVLAAKLVDLEVNG